MPTVISLPITLTKPLPSHFKHDIRYPQSFAQFCITQYSKKGQMVFDPFAGFGTTLIVAEGMNRKTFGIEFDSVKVDYIKTQLKDSDVIIQGDSTDLSNIPMQKFDLLLTSPPYMNKFETSTPFDNFEKKSTYQTYLNQIGDIFSAIEKLMNPQGTCLIEVSNLYNEEQLTTLAWDVANELRQIMSLQKEIIIQWTGKEKKPNRGTYGYGYDHSYLLVFKKLNINI